MFSKLSRSSCLGDTSLVEGMNQPLRRNKLSRVSNEDGAGNDFAAIRSS